MTEQKNLWGGRFSGKTDETFAEFNSSFHFDLRLFTADVRCSIAHCDALFRAGVLTPDECDEIKNGLLMLLRSAENEDFFDAEAEDVHSFIETKLVGLVGDVGGKLHAGRSRNDQVATAFRFWLREEIEEISQITKDVQTALVVSAESNKDAVLPGYTHLQRAQPVLWAHWCLAYFEMFSRDRERLTEARRRTNILPLGSAALAGTSYEIDREAVAEGLGFEAVSANSLDAVSDRDFAVEFAGVCALVMVHLSRLAEDLILYASSEFQFIELSDAVSTGSSLMPQKKNPDALELIRGKAGRVFGHQAALLAMLKGLPMAYNKDLQEDKEAVFDCCDTVRSCLKVASIVLENLQINKEKMARAATEGYLNATEFADYLVRKGVSFRAAHETVGKIVLFAISKKQELHGLDLEDLRQFSDKIEKDIFDALSLDQTLASKNQIGGTAPGRVSEALEKAKQKLKDG
jgi:argininosuccinate lyase